MNTHIRNYSALDRLICGAQQALETSTASSTTALRPSPSADIVDGELNNPDRIHSGGLMRINHTGEVCAQALYLGQAAVARRKETRSHLLEAAQEEADHLAWCADRLAELNTSPSIANPLWFAGSFAIGAAAGLAGDRLSLGFIVETERQVEAHLGSHLQELPANDQRSRAIVKTMQADEAQHADNAQARGATALPQAIPKLMRLAANVMRWGAYRF